VVEDDEPAAEPAEPPRVPLPRLVEKPAEEEPPAAGEAQVVSLDAFRKK